MVDSILTVSERTELISKVATLIYTGPVPLMSVIPQQHCLRIVQSPLPEAYAWSIVNYCEASAWMEDPALIVLLMRKWEHLPIFHDAIERIKAIIPRPFHIPPQVWDPILVRLNLPLLNRSITRRAVEGFSRPLHQPNYEGVSRVLVVTGPAGSGKSFTVLYVQYISQFLNHANFNSIYIDLKAQAVTRFGPLDLARLILDQVNPCWVADGVTLPELQEEQASRWINYLCRVIADQVALAGSTCVIILDGLDGSGGTQFLPAETLEMIACLVAIASTEAIPEVSRDMMRLVLLGFEQPVRNYLNTVRTERIKPVARDEIRKYFEDYARFYNKTIAADGIEDMVNAVLQDVPDDASRTRQLADKALAFAIGIINS